MVMGLVLLVTGLRGLGVAGILARLSPPKGETLMICSILFHRPARLAFVLGLLPILPAAQAAQLHPEAVKAFEQRVAAVDDWGSDRGGKLPEFLWTGRSDERRERLRRGEIIVGPRQGKGDTDVGQGLVHHWIGGMFVPGLTAVNALDLLRNFDSYKQIYAPSVEDSKTLRRDGDAYRAYLRLRKHHIVTVVLNTEYQAEFARVDSARWHSRSVSTRVAQVKDPGGPDERELPVGNDSGYLWRIATFWRFEEADGGLYLECEVIGLTRGVPFGLGWLVRPIIRGFPRESLTETLQDTRNALLGRSRDADPARVVSQAATPLAATPPETHQTALP